MMPVTVLIKSSLSVNFPPPNTPWQGQVKWTQRSHASLWNLPNRRDSLRFAILSNRNDKRQQWGKFTFLRTKIEMFSFNTFASIVCSLCLKWPQDPQSSHLVTIHPNVIPLCPTHQQDQPACVPSSAIHSRLPFYLVCLKTSKKWLSFRSTTLPQSFANFSRHFYLRACAKNARANPEVQTRQMTIFLHSLWSNSAGVHLQGKVLKTRMLTLVAYNTVFWFRQ